VLGPWWQKSPSVLNGWKEIGCLYDNEAIRPQSVSGGDNKQIVCYLGARPSNVPWYRSYSNPEVPY
jgi:hypothetical protein